MLGRLAASIIATLYVGADGADGSAVAMPYISTVNDLRVPLLILRSLSIGLRFRVAPSRAAGWCPIRCSRARRW